MATKKRAASKRVPARAGVNLRAAMAGGRDAAAEVLAFRAKQRRKRAAVQREMDAAPTTRPRGEAAQAAQVARLPASSRALFGKRKSIGVLIAEGDSWFDYPMQDVLRLLEDEHFYDVESVAHKGDNVEDMAHTEGQFEELARRVEKILGDGKVPRALLLSGGGNDIAGDEFALLLNHATSSLPPLNEDIVRGFIDVRLKAAYVRILSGLAEISKEYLGRPIPVVTHGYDYPVPDGRGFAGGWWKLPGPWLKPAFQRKGHGDLAQNSAVVAQLIDRFNAMLAQVSALPEFAHVRYLDLRGTLMRAPNNYKKHWANEMHPNKAGFRLVAQRFADAINQL